MLVYQRSHFKKNIKDFAETLQWFSLEPNYGVDSYGSTLGLYILKDSIKLLDIGKEKNRKLLTKLAKEKYPNVEAEDILSADEQYSGGRGNRNAHVLMKMLVGQYFDGTIIKDIDSDEDLKGPTEIVLWNFEQVQKLY